MTSRFIRPGLRAPSASQTDVSQLGRRVVRTRPVTFRYQQDPQSERQYGLIAQEVARVYPELVVRGDKGESQSVQYHELIPLILNEMQHQQAVLKELRNQNLMLRARAGPAECLFAARLERLERTARGP